MESIFCPEVTEHATDWVAAGSGVEAKCGSCVLLQLSIPGSLPCCLCRGMASGALQPLCAECMNQAEPQSNSHEALDEEPFTDLVSALTHRRRELWAHFNGAFDTTQSADPEPPVTDEQRLRRTELLLDESRLEVERLQQELQRLKDASGSQKPHLDASVFEGIVAKQSELSRLNGELAEKNRALTEALERQQSSSGTASGPGDISGLQGIIDKVPLRTAEKLVDMLPLLCDVHVSDTWINSKSIESFLGLAELGIQDPERAFRVRKITRTIVLIAKLIGRSKAVTNFNKAIKIRLQTDPERCLKLVQNLKCIYYKVFKDAGSPELMRELLHKLENPAPAFDGTVAVIAYLSEVLPPKQLTALSLALFRFLDRPQEETQEWMGALSKLPLKWEQEHREKALAGVQKLMAAVVKMDFHPSCLLLLQILNSYKHADPEPLMIFISRASECLQSEKPTEHVQVLVNTLFAFLRMDIPPERSLDLNEKAFSALRVYFQGAEVTREQVALLLCMLLSLQTNTFTNLIWLYGDTKTAGPVEFALKVLNKLEIHHFPLAKNAAIGVAFFSSLAQAVSLSAQEQLTFIKATYHLCEAKPTKAEEIVVTLTSMLNNQGSHFFAKDLAQLSEVNEGKGHVKETCKLLNAVRKHATDVVLPTGRYMASMISQLRICGIAVIIFTKELKVVLIQKTNNLKQVLAAIRPMMKAEAVAANLALRLIELLPKHPDEHVHLIAFVADLANNLGSAPMITNDVAIHFCEDAVLPCFALDNITLLVIMHSELQSSKVNYLVDMLRAVKRKLSTLDIYELCLLPNIQPEFMRIFDCARLDAKTVQLDQPIRVDTSSSYAFIDEGRIVSSGGSDCSSSRVGLSSNSRAIAVHST